MLTEKNYFLYILLCAVILFTILTYSVLINFKVENDKLVNRINCLKEEKTNLRAKYLSDICMHKLDKQAQAMNMSFANQNQIIKINNHSKHKLKKAFELGFSREYIAGGF